MTGNCMTMRDRLCTVPLL